MASNRLPKDHKRFNLRDGNEDRHPTVTRPTIRLHHTSSWEPLVGDLAGLLRNIDLGLNLTTPGRFELNFEPMARCQPRDTSSFTLTWEFPGQNPHRNSRFHPLGLPKPNRQPFSRESPLLPVVLTYDDTVRRYRSGYGASGPSHYGYDALGLNSAARDVLGFHDAGHGFSGYGSSGFSASDYSASGDGAPDYNSVARFGLSGFHPTRIPTTRSMPEHPRPHRHTRPSSSPLPREFADYLPPPMRAAFAHTNSMNRSELTAGLSAQPPQHNTAPQHQREPQGQGQGQGRAEDHLPEINFVFERTAPISPDWSWNLDSDSDSSVSEEANPHQDDFSSGSGGVAPHH
jgi:hypothetical protein